MTRARVTPSPRFPLVISPIAPPTRARAVEAAAAAAARRARVASMTRRDAARHRALLRTPVRRPRVSFVRASFRTPACLSSSPPRRPPPSSPTRARARRRRRDGGGMRARVASMKRRRASARASSRASVSRACVTRACVIPNPASFSSSPPSSPMRAARPRPRQRRRRRHARARRLNDATTRVTARIIAQTCFARVRHSSVRHPEPRFPLVVPPVVPHARAQRPRRPRRRWRRRRRHTARVASMTR